MFTGCCWEMNSTVVVSGEPKHDGKLSASRGVTLSILTILPADQIGKVDIKFL